jgi:hypothetical protein
MKSQSMVMPISMPLDANHTRHDGAWIDLTIAHKVSTTIRRTFQLISQDTDDSGGATTRTRNGITTADNVNPVVVNDADVFYWQPSRPLVHRGDLVFVASTQDGRMKCGFAVAVAAVHPVKQRRGFKQRFYGSYIVCMRRCLSTMANGRVQHSLWSWSLGQVGGNEHPA